MRTWSAEHALDGLLTGLGNIAGISASAILEILWPTPVDPAEQLAEREAEEEVAEPKFAPMPCCGGVLFHHHCPEANARRDADASSDPRLAVHIGEDGHLDPPDAVSQRFTVGVVDGQPYEIGRDVTLGPRYCGSCDETHEVPDDVGPAITGIKRRVRDFGADFIGPVVNECEPALSDDELVAVRGLIQERYADAVEQDTRTIFNIPNNSSSQTWGVNPGDESAPHSQAVASPATVGEPPDPAVAGHFNDEHLKDAIYFGLSTYSGPLRVVAHLIAMDVLHKFRVSNK